MKFLKKETMNNENVISEEEFLKSFSENLLTLKENIDFVTGPGRSGAVASVYASYLLSVPFVPYGQKIPGKKALIVDTVVMTGKTIRKASRKYDDAPYVFGILVSKKRRLWFETYKENFL